MEPDITELAKEWIRIDQETKTREQIYRLLHEGKKDELEQRLHHRIAFGTAGLRARMEAGFARMNSVTVIQASQGLAEYLLQNVPDTKHRGIVIGRDARHNSEKFAKLTAASFVAKGIKVWWLEPSVSTPMVPFGVKELGAVAGVMITASHNPKEDNGYKVYWGNGAQIIPPHDKGIAAAIEANAEPLQESWDKKAVETNMLVEGSFGFVERAYFNAVVAAADPKERLRESRNMSEFAYTAMHGVGLRYMTSALEALGIEKSMTVVEEQAQPDPEFPTVKFPNPEEKGAMDVAIATAEKNGLSLILASDPDADRLAVAQKLPTGEWKQFTGNQLGILLASHILDAYTKPRDKLAMLSSTVSSRMLDIMAEKEGFKHAETLTGFKWMGNIALDLDAEGYDTRFAFEEAIGYMIPGVVKDKDSVAAAAVFLAACSRWHEEGLTPWDKLQELYEKYGYFEDANTYLTSPSPEITTEVFERVRALGSPFPQTLGSRKVLKWRDLTKGWQSDTEDHKPNLAVDESSQMITCEMEGDVRFTVRGSGTEPKIKFYIEGKGENSEIAHRKAEDVLLDLLKEWFRPDEWGLKTAGS
jgi:phosphoglucomutase